MQRRFLRLVAAAASVALTISAAGCAGSGDTGGEQVIKVWTFLDPTSSDPRGQVLAKVIDQFEKANPGVEIAVESKPYQTLTSAFLAAATAGNGPDVIWTTLDDVRVVSQQGALVDLSTSDVFSDHEDVAVWDQMKINGAGPYGVLTSINHPGLLYRADLLEQAGVSPDDLATWDGFVKAVNKLTDKDKGISGFGQAYGELLPDAPIMVAKSLDSQDSMFTEDGKPVLDTSAVADALQLEADLFKSGATPQAALEWTSADIYDQLAAGRVAIINGASTRVSATQKQVGADKIGYAPLPSDGKNRPRVFIGWSVGVWSGSTHKETAEKFIHYALLDKSSDLAWSTEASQIPLLKSTAKEADLAPFIRVATDAVATNWWKNPYDVMTAGFFGRLNKAAQAVVRDGVAPADALKTVADELNKG